VVSYYARARDNDAVSGPHTAATDIYFLQVRPFGQTYRQAEQQGGGGGDGETPNGLSERQRQIVAATHKLVRDSGAAPERQRREDLATLALAQGRLREQVGRLAERVRERGGFGGGGGAGGDSSVQAIAEALPLAEAAMREAEEQLGRRRAGGALPPEQRALQQLQRAEAAFRDVQVSLGGPSAPGGGGGATPEELADLFGLEADRLRNQYETVQRGGAAREAASAEVDRTMERLRELAERQQRESERMRREGEALRQAAGQQAGGGGGGGDAQRQLAQEAEQLARQLERLSREEPPGSGQQGALQQGARQLQAAADQMRRAAAASPDAAASAAAAARARLDAARQRLTEGRAAAGAQGIEEARRRAAALAEEQRRVGADAERVAGGEGRGGEAERRLGEQKGALEAGVGALERDLDRLARELRRESPEAARRMQGAADAIRDGQVRERIRFSRDLVRRGSPEYARNLEQQIAATLDDVRRRVDGAATAAGPSPERAGSQSVARARALARGVASLGERLEQRREAARGGAPGQPAGGPGRAGQPGGGQPAGRQQAGPPGSQGGGQGGAARGALAQGGGPGGGQPGGEAGGQARPGAGGGAAAGAAGAGALSPDDVRQFAREMAERRADAEALRRGLAQQGVPTADLEALIGRMRALERARAYDDPEEAARLQAAVADGLKAFEFALRRRVEGAGGERVRLGAGDQVPPGFRALVEEYYRSLARGGGR
jgi:hypothetical protein